MPNRYIRASAIESEPVNALSWLGEVFYRRLLNRADDFGRFTANPDLLRASLFPLKMDKVSSSDILKLLKECEDVGLLFQYIADGKRCIVMNKWEQGRAHKSEYPQPPADIIERMQTYVYTSKHMSTYVPDSDSDSDSDPDTDTDPEWMFSDFLETWKSWKTHRKEIRHALTKSTARKQLQMLSKLGKEKAVAAIAHSIQNGWTGIFEPKQIQPPQTKQLGFIPDAISK